MCQQWAHLCWCILLPLLLVFLCVWSPVQGGCTERGFCCAGRNNNCTSFGPTEKSDKNTTCFCDEACRFLGDCCKDHRKVCIAADCEVGKWEDWGKCDKECGWGVLRRHRKIIKMHENGGKECPSLVQKRPCLSRKCKVQRHSGFRELRETARIIPASFGSARGNKKYNPFKGIRRNLFLKYNSNMIITRPTYCATFEISDSRKWCNTKIAKGWSKALYKRGTKICLECQQAAMKQNLGVRCKGHGMYQATTRWNAIGIPGCHGKWVMKTKHSKCSCDPSLKTSFIFI